MTIVVVTWKSIEEYWSVSNSGFSVAGALRFLWNWRFSIPLHCFVQGSIGKFRTSKVLEIEGRIRLNYHPNCWRINAGYFSRSNRNRENSEFHIASVNRAKQWDAESWKIGGNAQILKPCFYFEWRDGAVTWPITKKDYHRFLVVAFTAPRRTATWSINPA